MRTCEQCGMTSPDSAAFCTTCGTRLPEREATTEQGAPTIVAPGAYPSPGAAPPPGATSAYPPPGAGTFPPPGEPAAYGPPGGPPPSPSAGPGTGPRPGSGRDRALIVTAAVLAIGVAVGVYLLLTRSSDEQSVRSGDRSVATDSSDGDRSGGAGGSDEPGGATTTTEPSTTTTASTTTSTSTPSTTTTLTPAEQAHQDLLDLQASSRSRVEQVVDTWVPQVSSKYVGLQADGITYDEAAIVADHRAWRARFPQEQVALLWSGDYTSFKQGNIWVTVVIESYPTSEGAKAWCDQAGLDADNCYAKLISHTHGPDGATDLRN
jgi:hypothetical protein